ncbi:MAG: DHHA1 domain-containing protein [Evtepia gabavorous]
MGRAIAGQAADELLNIAGIEASFVLFPEAGQAYLSARSNSDVNVQVISEMLGGGGNAATAGAQFPGKTPEEVLPLLKNAIDTYFDDEKS